MLKMSVNIILLSVFFLSGCSTSYYITTKPSGADVTIMNKIHGVSPYSVKYSNSGGKTVNCIIKKDGYKTISTTLGPQGGSIHFDLEDLSPTTFVKTFEPAWASVQIRKDYSFDSAWNNVLDLFVRKFDIAILEKESGYVRTNWVYTWTGSLRDDYRVRVTAKFNPERNKVDIKSEANYKRPNGGWVQGSDTALLQTLKADVMGSIGRISR